MNRGATHGPKLERTPATRTSNGADAVRRATACMLKATGSSISLQSGIVLRTGREEPGAGIVLDVEIAGRPVLQLRERLAEMLPRAADDVCRISGGAFVGERVEAGMSRIGRIARRVVEVRGAARRRETGRIGVDRRAVARILLLIGVVQFGGGRNRAKVRFAGGRLRLRPGVDEIGYEDPRKNRYDRDDDHQLDEREACLPIVSCVYHRCHLRLTLCANEYPFVVIRDAIAPLVLAVIHRSVGSLQELVGGQRIARKSSDADARGDRRSRGAAGRALRVPSVRGNYGAQRAGARDRFGLLDVRKNEAKLVPAVAGDEIAAGGSACAQHAGQPQEDRVARSMTVGVVPSFKMIRI